MKRIIIGVLIAWAGIVALAWWLADQRLLETCNINVVGERYGCDLSAMATRDNVLIWGAAIPLGLFVLIILLGLVRLQRLNRRSGLPTSRGVQKNR